MSFETNNVIVFVLYCIVSRGRCTVWVRMTFCELIVPERRPSTVVQYVRLDRRRECTDRNTRAPLIYVNCPDGGIEYRDVEYGCEVSDGERELI